MSAICGEPGSRRAGEAPLANTCQRRVVRHEMFLVQILFEHGMPAVADVHDAFRAHLRAAIIVKPRGFGEARQHIQLREGGGGLLDLRQSRQHGFAHAQEQFVFQLDAALLRAEDFSLHLLQLGRDEPLAVGDGLLADVFRRHFVQIAARDLDVIAEDRIEPHLQRRDARALDFVLLQFRDPILAAARGGAQFIQRGVETVANQPALLQRQRRFLHNRAAQSTPPSPAIRRVAFPIRPARWELPGATSFSSFAGARREEALIFPERSEPRHLGSCQLMKKLL